MLLGDPFVIQVSILLFLIFNIQSAISTITLLSDEQPYLFFNPFNEEEGEGEGNLHLHLKYVFFQIFISFV